MFDDHVIFEGQMSSQRSTRAKSAASFYYCTYLASLEWAILTKFLKIYVKVHPPPRTVQGLLLDVLTCTISKNTYFNRKRWLPDRGFFFFKISKDRVVEWHRARAGDAPNTAAKAKKTVVPGRNAMPVSVVAPVSVLRGKKGLPSTTKQINHGMPVAPVS